MPYRYFTNFATMRCATSPGKGPQNVSPTVRGEASEEGADKAKVGYWANPEKMMPEWEEVAAVSCAVQNLHLMATSLGVAGYWSSGGPIDEPRVVSHLGLSPTDGDRCLGLFHLGSASVEKVAAYRAKRGDIYEKTTFLSSA